MRLLPVLTLTLCIGCAGEETCSDWYCADGRDTAAVAAGTSKGGDTKTTSTKPTTTVMGSNIWTGDLDATTGMGEVAYSAETECALVFDVDTAVSANCPECEFAWILTLGDHTVVTDVGDCLARAELLSQDAFGVGHATDGTLYYEKNGSWNKTGASATVGNDWSWDFAY